MLFSMIETLGAGPDAGQPRLASKLAQFGPLSPPEIAALARVLGAKVQRVRAGVPLIEAGDAPTEVQVVLDGWAARSRTAPNGRRQIVAFHMPGDVCDFDALLMHEMDSTVIALSDMRVAAIGRAALGEFTRAHPRLAQGLWWESLSAASIQRQWLVRNGQCSARERMAGLICELAVRLRAVGLADDAGFELPLTQYHLADACALTPEHINRTLRELRQEGLVTIERGRLRFGDSEALSALAGFDPAYLHFRHLRREPRMEAAIPVPG